MKYNHLEIEPKWQRKWEEDRVFATPELKEGDQKAYILDMFPYPSGSGLHVGHLLGYTGSDILARQARMAGKKVLHPMGWDAFGLPAENFALKSGVHPAISTERNINEYKRQFKQTGISYDWSREINTSKPDYYKWTQWLFTLLYKRGLAYRKEGLVNWCPGCQTVLANEQVINGACERCGSGVVQKSLKQWYFKITDYAERLLSGLDGLDWPERIKTMQRNWIGKSEGARLAFAIENREEKLEVFTTRPDTIFGATYMVLAPEHPLVSKITTKEQAESVKRYQQQTAQKTELERSFLEKEKSGVFTGGYAINPATKTKIPIWIADYVILSYGTGAIMAVPAHDERDYQFAQKFNLPIVQVIEGDTLPWVEKGRLLNSGKFSGKEPQEIMDYLLEELGAKREITYRLRDWLVSRQRFWGAPIPVIYGEEGEEKVLEEEELPVELPMDVEFLPTGQSPLTLAEKWKEYKDKNGKIFYREVDTLDTFVCSSWYFLRFASPQEKTEAFREEDVKKWLPVDTYLGGAEHAVLHLLYARFITKVLHDAGLLEFDEPFLSLRNQGMILGPDHNKMSKSKGNVINPDDVIKEFGADSLRVYEMFMAPFELEKPWSVRGIAGVRRFLEKIWRLQTLVKANTQASNEELKAINTAVKKVTEDIASLKFNTAVSAMMEAANRFLEIGQINRDTLERLITVLNPFAPHITEEIWQNIGNTGYLSLESWPQYDQKYLEESDVEYPVQINGKIRLRVVLPSSLGSAEVLEKVKQEPKVVEMLKTQSIKKELVVEKRLVSLVIG